MKFFRFLLINAALTTVCALAGDFANRYELRDRETGKTYRIRGSFEEMAQQMPIIVEFEACAQNPKKYLNNESYHMMGVYGCHAKAITKIQRLLAQAPPFQRMLKCSNILGSYACVKPFDMHTNWAIVEYIASEKNPEAQAKKLYAFDKACASEDAQAISLCRQQQDFYGDQCEMPKSPITYLISLCRQKQDFYEDQCQMPKSLITDLLNNMQKAYQKH